MQENIVTVISSLFSSLNLQIERAHLQMEIEKHPAPNSLLAISDILNRFKIRHESGQCDLETVLHSRLPFIAFITDPVRRVREFAFVGPEEQGVFLIKTDGQPKKRITKLELEAMYSGFVILPKPDRQNDTKHTATNIMLKTPYAGRQFAVILLVMVLLLPILLHVSMSIYPLMGLIFFFNLTGASVSSLLVFDGLGGENKFTQLVCGANNRGCNKVLRSHAAIAFKGISWSEIGLFYFTIAVVSMIIWAGDLYNLGTLYAISILSLPFTIYSIYYQKFIAKEWCRLCLAILVVLWSNAVSFFFLFHGALPKVSWISSSRILILLLIISMIYKVLKPLLVKMIGYSYLRQQYSRLKYQSGIFELLLNKQMATPVPDGRWSITIGNQDAQKVITLVTNPHCPPCKLAHLSLEDLIAFNPDVSARIVFQLSGKEDDPSLPVVNHLLALNQLPDKSLVQSALHGWYGNIERNYESWAKAYPLTGEEAPTSLLEAHRRWCNESKVNVTPSIWLNGLRLPEQYQLNDITYMLI